MKDEEDSVKDEADSEEENNEEENEDESGPSSEKADLQNLLYSWQSAFEKQLRQQNRGLCVKDLILSFSPESIYGNRSAFLKGLMVTAPYLHATKICLQ